MGVSRAGWGLFNPDMEKMFSLAETMVELANLRHAYKKRMCMLFICLFIFTLWAYIFLLVLK